MKTPSKEQVLNSAKTSTEVKEELKKLFPEYFEDDKAIDLSGLASSKTNNTIFPKAKMDKLELPHDFMEVRDGGPYHNKGIFLCMEYNWKLVKEPSGINTLVPTKKN